MAIKDFLQMEATAGAVLFLTTLCAVIFVNSPWSHIYTSIINASVAGSPLIFWVNEGLMAIFFLFIGLELKREFLEGELSGGLSKIVLPGVAALGGMLIPALIYIALNYSVGTLRGWAIPVATDIAFALGVLAFFSKRIPLSLKLFLLALAVFDDLGAVIIIAIFYTHEFSFGYFLLVYAVMYMLWAVNKMGRFTILAPYVLLGILLWFFVLRSGIHASMAGVLLALMIPREGLLIKLEKRLHPWVAFLILPLFAFCNAGLSFTGMSWSALGQPVVLGIMTGLFIGKQVGVLVVVWLMQKYRLASWPAAATWLDIYGIALLCGIGFTMSLFLGTLAFSIEQTAYLMEVRLGVFLGSMLSAVSGAVILQLSYLQKQNRMESTL